MLGSGARKMLKWWSLLSRRSYLFAAAAAAAAAKLLQSCLTLYDAIDGSPQGSPAPPSLGFSRQEHWSGLPFLLQCKKVKSESGVAQLYPTLRDPMDCSPSGSSVHGDSPGKNTSPGDFSDPGIKSGSPALQVYSLPSELPGKPFFALA